MGMSIKPNARGAGIAAPVSEINVTPLVDVMLVLLIVFMVAAPLMAAGVKVDLPTSNAKPLTEEKPPIVLTIDRAGKLYLDKNEVRAQDVVAAVRAATDGDTSRRINLRGDKALEYGKVIATMGDLSDAGFAKIALVSEQPEH